jgi:hypothetical protein
MMMMPEDNGGPHSTREHSLDELAKGLASGTVSRRQALRLMGGALLGGVLASIPGGVALAQRGGGNTACDEFCHTAFSGREAGQCASAGARGRGPCFECTPGVGPGPSFTPECGEGETFNPTNCTCEPTTVPCPRAPGGACLGAGSICCEPPSPTGQALCCPPGSTCCHGTGSVADELRCCPPDHQCATTTSGQPICL